MLVIHELVLEDFGPFKGSQTLPFPESGVAVVFGENMRGKTTLLNAIRFVLLGKIIGRAERQASIHRIGNWEAAAVGRFGFGVSLRYSVDGVPYQTHRRCKPRPNVDTPASDADYTMDLFVRRDGAVLGPQEAEYHLSVTMPEEVSRFFLFDGELLQQYEELLREESEAGYRIKEAIERILGIPILTNARDNLDELTRSAQRAESQAAKRSTNTANDGRIQEALVDNKQVRQDSIAKYVREKEEVATRKSELEAAMRRHERSRALLDKRDGLLEARKVTDASLHQAQEELKDLLRGGWLFLLSPLIQEKKRDLEAQLTTDQDNLLERFREELRLRSLADSQCSLCQRPLGPEALLSLRDSGSSPTSLSEPQESIRLTRSRLDALRRLESTSLPTDLSRALGQIDDLRVKTTSLRTDIEDVSTEIGSIDETEVRRLRTEYDRTVCELALLDKSIEEERAKLADIESKLREVQRRLEAVDDLALRRERSRRSLCDDFHQLLRKGIDAYRDRLRTQVEAHATDLFRRLTTEAEYAKLKINDSYGLSIIHQDGQLIPVRSAGAEHVVALSLMGALQKSSPLNGPVIMDSPFGRLDSAHTEKVLECLPYLSRQVILLVYESEVDRQVARERLGPALKAEYKISRRGARYSELTPILGD